MKRNALKWLWSVTGRKKIYIIFLTIIQAIYGASGVLYALVLRMIVDAAVGQDSRGFFSGIVLIVLLVLLQLSLRAVIRWLTEYSKASCENILKMRLMDALLYRDYLSTGSVHSAEWMNRMTNDTGVVSGNMVDIVPGLSEMVVKLFSALIMIIVLEPGFAAVLIPGGVLLILFTWLFRRNLKSMHKTVQEKDGDLRIFLQERIGSMLVIRSFAAEKQTQDDAAFKMEEHKKARMRKTRFSNLCNIGFGAAMSGMYLLGVGWCGYGILMGSISFGTLTAITQLITQIQTPFANITGYLPKYYAMIASAERLMEAENYQKMDEKILSPEEIAEFYGDLNAFGLRNVGFTYPDTCKNILESEDNSIRPVINDLSVSFRKGEYVAFTGRSGCGKSTALKLLMCVITPDEGKAFYRDINGNEGELTSEHRRLFAYVPQGNVLMNGTIRDVVSFAKPDSSNDDEKLMKALQIACADGFISELEQGMDSVLGERGTGISEGQMQRLSIARAVFSEAPVLLLDEATSALDADTERRLLDNLRNLTDKTVLIVTHRPAVLSICDRVLEFTEDGIIEHGCDA